MKFSANRRLQGLIILLALAVAFATGMHLSGRCNFGSMASMGSHSMEGCCSMEMDQQASGVSVKDASEMTSAAGCPMMGMTHSMVVQNSKKITRDPLDTCPVTGNKLGSMGAPVVKTYAGREVRFCCGGCPAKFEQDLQANLSKLDAAIANSKAGQPRSDSPIPQDQHAVSRIPTKVVRQDHSKM